MLSADLTFNLNSIKSYSFYSCELPDGCIEQELSFCVPLGPGTERRGDVFPFYRVPENKVIELTDWSFNTGGPENKKTSVGGSIGRIYSGTDYMILLNCAVHAGQMTLFSPARPIRYVPGEWMALCFHHMGDPNDVRARATFRFIESPDKGMQFQTSFSSWAGTSSDHFDYEEIIRNHGT